MHERNLRGKKRILANETLRAVDRIDKPQVFGIVLRTACFLAVKAVLRESARESILRMACSHSTSAWVTGVMSALVVTVKLPA